MKALKFSKPQITFFSEHCLVFLVSVVTLLLQLISFATTWNGSRIYLEGVFPYASLLFAIAIQSTAYFFSNSLRIRMNPLKVLALLAALCCSTYYSYIGIYNSVNSPVSYLQENYVRIDHDLTQIYQTKLAENLSSARESVSDAASLITARYTSLIGEQRNIDACRAMLAEIQNSYSTSMRAPSLSSYENYEDYAAAYQAYIAGISEGSSVENDSLRNRALSSYGYTSIDELTEAQLENSASLNALTAALGITDAADTDITKAVSSLSLQLSAAIDQASLGQSFNSDDMEHLDRLFQAAKLCGYQGDRISDVVNTVSLCAKAAETPLLSDYLLLVSSLTDGQVTSANTMDFKSAMDAEILNALIKINTLLPEAQQISYSDPRFQITDLYLIPVQAIKASATRTTACFCLAIAALIDALSVLFAVSLRKKKPLWKKHTLLYSKMEEYVPQIYASLPDTLSSPQALADFLSHFLPGSGTEGDGYMMQADMHGLNGYYPLAALLCQVNLAKIVPAGFLDNDTEILLLKARFVFWANTIIQKDRDLL